MAKLEQHLTESRLSWGVDKALLAIVSFYAIKTYNTIEAMSAKIYSLETEIALLKQAIKHLGLE